MMGRIREEKVGRRDGVGKREEGVKHDGEDRRENNNKEVRRGIEQ
jgi:hypothetical protein